MGIKCQLKPINRARPLLSIDEISHTGRITQAALSGSVAELEKLVCSDPDVIYWKDGEGQSVLHLASSKDKVAVIEWAIQAGADINGQNKQGCTALHISIENDAYECLETLLQRGANSCLANNKKQAPIHLGTQLNKPQALQILSKYMARVDTLNGGEHGRTALHIAAIHNFAECAKLILSSGLKSILRKTCDNGFTPLHEAARNSSGDTLDVMLDWGEKMGLTGDEMMKYGDAEGNLPLHLAVHSGDIKAVRVCLMRGARISAQQRDMSSPVHLACSLGELDIVKLMFTMQAEEKKLCLESCDAQQMTALHYAAMFDHVTILEYLLAEGANIDAVDLERRTPLLLGASRGAWPTVHFLLEHGSDIREKDITNRNIIHYIVMNGGNLKELTPHMAEKQLHSMLNEKDSQGCTPLHYASRGGQIRSTESLIQMGACVNLKNNDNKSPLHFAARFGRYNTMLELLQSERGPCIINEADGQGLTPLHIASQNGHTRIVRLLLSKGALLQRDHSGRTPLHLAAMNGFTHTMELLLSVHSHLLDQVDKDGNTPLHLATQENHPSAITLLLNTNCQFIQNNNQHTPMDLALLFKHCESAMAMATHQERAFEILQMDKESSEGVVHSLIALMPEVILAVLDQSITRANFKQDSQSYFVKYSFKYLQYSREMEKHMEDRRGDIVKHLPLPAMNTMVRFRRLELLTHPVCQKYIQMKWNAYGKYFHTANLIMYMVFMAFLTFYSLRLMTLIDPQETEEKSSGVTTVKLRRATLHNHKIQISASDYFTGMVVMSFVITNCVKEIIQLYQQKVRYILDVINALEWILYISSGFMVVPMFTGFISDFHLTCAATAIFIAWFNFLMYLQRFDRVGIYVVMFLEILQTLIKALLIFSILVIAFGLSFFILMSRGDHLGFSNISISIIRVFSMMLGEFDFLGTFVLPYFNASPNDTSLPYPHYSMAFLIAFMVLMPILLVNLLIGLAVGDIDSVRQNAYLKRLAMQVELHTELERKLPTMLLNRVDKVEVIEYPNSINNSQCPWKSTGECQIRQKYKGSGGRFILHEFWNQVQQWFGSVYTNSGDKMHEINSSEEDAMCAELQKQKLRLKDVSTTLTQLHQMVRLIVQKMEIRTEANDMDEGTAFHDRKHSKWSSPTLAVKLRSLSALMKARKRR